MVQNKLGPDAELSRTAAQVRQAGNQQVEEIDMTLVNGLRSLVVMITLIAFVTVPARAEDEPAIIKALYDTFFEMSGTRPSHDTLVTDAAGNITITGLKMLMQNFQQEGEDIRQDLTAARMVIKDVSELSEGMFEAGELMLTSAVVNVTTPTVETFKMTIPVVESKQAIIRAPSTIKTPLDRLFAQSFLARSTSIPLATVSVGEWSIDVHDIKFGWDGDPKTFLGATTYSIGSIEVPTSTLDQTGASPSLSELGYKAIVLGLTGRASMDMKDVDLEFDGDVALLAREMGALLLAGAIGGVKPELLEAAQAVRESPNTIDMNAMMVMLKSISVGHFKLRYEDASLAERLLTYVEKKEGKTREQIIQESVAMSDIGLAAAGSPDLNAQIKAALEVFLRNPGWIELELRPAQPVTASQIMRLLGTPAEIVKLLNIKISAGPAAE